MTAIKMIGAIAVLYSLAVAPAGAVELGKTQTNAHPASATPAPKQAAKEKETPLVIQNAALNEKAKQSLEI